ncbi:MAG TPA: Ig-like domain-containing protein, partial [Gemmatimonadaceae bacterium]|nr:Ig-like domain-containing protein [Gemmatimonadaceae bacterium]
MVTLRSIRLCSALVLTFLLAACGSDSTPPGDNAGGIAPTVSSTNPSSDGSGVPLNVTVAATFSAAMDPATLTASSFTVKQ